ncbi:hypothetical protein, partial [Calditerrivibrio sp.]|uniref:hypothetical protein n=1 Tax=Calditerrivibrio sp. TaxID=2792612 RepID=UPI003D0F1BB4
PKKYRCMLIVPVIKKDDPPQKIKLIIYLLPQPQPFFLLPMINIKNSINNNENRNIARNFMI